MFSNEVLGVLYDEPPVASPVALSPELPVACKLFPLISYHIVELPVKLSGLKTSKQSPRSLVTMPGLYEIATCYSLSVRCVQGIPLGRRSREVL